MNDDSIWDARELLILSVFLVLGEGTGVGNIRRYSGLRRKVALLALGRLVGKGKIVMNERGIYSLSK